MALRAYNGEYDREFTEARIAEIRAMLDCASEFGDGATVRPEPRPPSSGARSLLRQRPRLTTAALCFWHAWGTAAGRRSSIDRQARFDIQRFVGESGWPGL